MPVGGRVRMRAELLAVDEIPGGAQIATELTFEREGGQKPVCVASRWHACTSVRQRLPNRR